MCDLICGAVDPRREISPTNKPLRYIKKKDWSLDWDHSGSNGVIGDKIEVIGEGTKLMKSLRLPTVLIRVCNRELAKSTVYHVLLEDESGNFPIQKIAGIMFSNPLTAACRTQFAELLPLKVEVDGKGGYSIKPLLLRERYKQLFINGCSLKVLDLEGGRCTEDSETLPWNQWKPSFPAMRSIISEILHKDIREMPVSIIDRATPSITKNCSSNWSSLRGGPHRNFSFQETSKLGLSFYYPNLRFPGVAASGGSSFAKWFKAIPPDIHIDKNFKCDRGTTLRKDNFLDERTFHKYLNLPEAE